MTKRTGAAICPKTEPHKTESIIKSNSFEACRKMRYEWHSRNAVQHFFMLLKLLFMTFHVKVILKVLSEAEIGEKHAPKLKIHLQSSESSSSSFCLCQTAKQV